MQEKTWCSSVDHSPIWKPFFVCLPPDQSDQWRKLRPYFSRQTQAKRGSKLTRVPLEWILNVHHEKIHAWVMMMINDDYVSCKMSDFVQILTLAMSDTSISSKFKSLALPIETYRLLIMKLYEIHQLSAAPSKGSVVKSIAGGRMICQCRHGSIARRAHTQCHCLQRWPLSLSRFTRTRIKTLHLTQVDSGRSCSWDLYSFVSKFAIPKFKP